AAAEHQAQADLPVREVGERHDGPLADPQHLAQHLARLARGLQGLAQDHVVERIVGIVAQVGVGVALDHRQAVGHAGVDAGLAQFHAARVDLLEVHQIGQERAVAAADIERARGRVDHIGDELQIDANGGGHGTSFSPRTVPAPLRKPAKVRNISGSSSRKASWPLSLSTSTKETLAAAAFSAWTISRLSRVGNSQSLVKDIRQNRVGVPLKALASTPPWAAARSKYSMARVM